MSEIMIDSARRAGGPPGDGSGVGLAAPPRSGRQVTARVLLGWLPPDRAEELLASAPNVPSLPAERRSMLLRAREAVAARAPGVDQSDLLSEPPVGLADHISRLRATAAGAEKLQRGCRVRMVDLSRVVAHQPHVFSDVADGHIANVDTESPRAVAELTLPVEPPDAAAEAAFTQHYDEQRRIYTFTSTNPNLKVLGNISAPLRGASGVGGFGFAVGTGVSFVEVARCQGRYVLRDGYHRAAALLRRGVSRVPALVRDSDGYEPSPSGMIPLATVLGPRPPLLGDYHDDLVSVTVLRPGYRRVIVIQGLELSVLDG
ncbi:hypothetical protein QTQ03_09395 [Micromonospora sp. WMMA1363]|uniref:hypothetical protein n=1 Tax=Micromonospora sp. WMMA1363 TaxID=3053985 RepID=UPI00259D158D|nr:hypothetical protein [Micromonospora sp. WMMA1363]MDM4719781.1 hypothetical protein [Micromonospora sp. WMMA1363]